MENNKYVYNLGQHFENVVKINPNKVAIIQPEDQENIDFKALNILSNKISNYLINQDLQKKDVIAIMHDKSSIAYSIMIACLKLGIIYTNIDPKSPKTRLEKIIQISQPKLLFVFQDLDEDFEIDVINYQGNKFNEVLTSSSVSLKSLNIEVNSNNPAYLMFTSGSTGFPKGVIISHQNVLNFIAWSKKAFSIDSNDSITSINPPYFDNSVFDFFGSLFNGASLISIDYNLLITPKKLIEYLNIKKPTIWFSVPSMLVFMLNLRALNSDDLPTLKKIIFGGEGFPKNQLRKLWNLWGDQKVFFNVYGPTECTCICSSYELRSNDLESDELLPLGPIADNFYFHILDKEGQKVAENQMGELYIGGPNVGLGYFNDIAKTEQVFIYNPFQLTYKEKIYKSGDIVRYDSINKLLHFHGRTDNQIKKMGFRIELEEIETALNSLNEINECAVISSNQNDRAEIIACICSNNFDVKEVLKMLKGLIPYYMIPDKFLEFERLPKNANGKIDRQTLKNTIYEK